MPDLKSVYVKRTSVVTREIAGQKMLVPVTAEMGDLETIYSMNAVASFIWDALDGRQTLGQVLEAVRDVFDISGERAEKDLLGFIAELEQSALITVKKTGDGN